MRIDSQRDVRLGVTEALADGDDIYALVDKLARMSVPQGVERHFRDADAGREVAPCLAAGDSREWGAFDISEQQGVIR